MEVQWSKGLINKIYPSLETDELIIGQVRAQQTQMATTTDYDYCPPTAIHQHAATDLFP